MYNKKYQIVLADCPWEYSRDMGKNSHNGGITYKTLTMEDLGALPVKEITDKDCALFMWGTWPKLAEAEYVIEKWGFSLKTCAFVWVKLNPTGELIEYNKYPHLSIDKDILKSLVDENGKIDYKEFLKHSSELSGKDLTLKKGFYSGMGNWTNANSEFCLFAKKGTPHRKKKDVKQIVCAPRGRHSSKPKEVIHNRIIDIIGDVPRIELFGREEVSGWDVIGNEVGEKLDITESLAKIIEGINSAKTNESAVAQLLEEKKEA